MSGTTHNGLAPLTSINNKENVTQACLQAHEMEVFSQLMLVDHSSLYQDDKNTNQHSSLVFETGSLTEHEAHAFE